MKNKFSLSSNLVLLILIILLKEINTQQNENHYNAASNMVSEYGLNKLLGERRRPAGDEFKNYLSFDTSKKYHDLKKNLQKRKINELDKNLIGLFYNHKLDKLESTK